VEQIARELYEARPYISQSQLAHAVGKAVDSHLPEHFNDALAEETFARIHNTTSLRSRHFRIYTHGEIVTKERRLPDGTLLREGGRVLARSSKVYEVFLRPVRDETGELTSVKFEVLNARSL